MIRIITLLFGIAFIFAGVAGFMPSFMQDNLLLGYFEVDAIHNMVHLIAGILAIMSLTSYVYARLYLQIFGVIYGILAIIGFVYSGDLGFMMLHVNTADNFLHLAIAVVALYFGFAFKKTK